MSVSVGGLGLVFLRSPFAELVGAVLGKTDLRSMFCLIVFFIVTSVLAYLTNPTENSFRAYLMEQSFRQHLSRLDDDDNKNLHSHMSRRNASSTAHTLSYDNSPPFHFANSASISLKTPKHIFHSFGLFTVAAMVPLARSTRPNHRETLIISDSWYIGAFGRWWRGGIIEAWYQDIIARSKDEESWSSGILSIKNLDRLTEHNELPFSTKSLPPHLLSRGSPPKLRNREKSSQRPVIPARSSTPPPLPKTASLPLHAARLPVSAAVSDKSTIITTQPLRQNSTSITDQVNLDSQTSRSSSTLFDQSPCIAEVLRQLSLSKASVHDLRTQISDCQNAASQSHSMLQSELDSFRERKREEDASKLDTKARIKTLDDSKRSAESMKRDSEKKLKAAQNARDNAAQRMEHLEKDIIRLQRCLVEDEAVVNHSENSISEVERDIAEALELKKREIKMAEDVVSALNQRARLLEEKWAAEKEKLACLKAQTQAQRPAFSSHSSPTQYTVSSDTVWASGDNSSPHNSVPGLGASFIESPKTRETLSSFEAINSLGRRPSISVDTAARSRNPMHAPSNFSPTSTSYSSVVPAQTVSRSNGYPTFDDGLLSPGQPTATYNRPSTFSPFGDLDPVQSSIISPTSQSLIPSALIDKDAGLPRSFQSESDEYLGNEWRSISYKQHGQTGSSDGQDLAPMMKAASPVSPHSSAHSIEHDPFEAHFLQSNADHLENFLRGHRAHQTLSEQSVNQQRTSWLDHVNSEQPDFPQEEAVLSSSPVAEKFGPHRWFTPLSKDRHKKGLNPDAKVFSFSRKQPTEAFSSAASFDVSPPANVTSSYDVLNPNGLGSNAVPVTTSVSNSFSRAFAPSPAEREALQRALGNSSNTSLERLPILTNVGSMPSSPSHVPALPTTVSQHSLAKILPAWLQSLPPRKANFSPWDDEEPQVAVDDDIKRRR